jgi:hypothetical protein
LVQDISQIWFWLYQNFTFLYICLVSLVLLKNWGREQIIRLSLGLRKPVSGTVEFLTWGWFLFSWSNLSFLHLAVSISPKLNWPVIIPFKLLHWLYLNQTPIAHKYACFIISLLRGYENFHDSFPLCEKNTSSFIKSTGDPGYYISYISYMNMLNTIGNYTINYKIFYIRMNIYISICII